ncbi:MAG: hypothetical protein AAFX01_02965 [Cyanobacteria bacterium J06638_28]
MSLSSSPKDDHVVCYRLSLSPDRVKLRLWEPAPLPNPQYSDNHPYLYAANWQFQHLSEAEAFLRNHLRANGAAEVPESEFPTEGKVTIPLLITWGLDKSLRHG